MTGLINALSRKNSGNNCLISLRPTMAPHDPEETIITTKDLLMFRGTPTHIIKDFNAVPGLDLWVYLDLGADEEAAVHSYLYLYDNKVIEWKDKFPADIATKLSGLTSKTSEN